MPTSIQQVIGKGYADFWNTKKRYRIVKGGRGSKKSTTTALWYITNMMQYPLANALVVRKVFKDHRDSTFAQLKWAIYKLHVQHLWRTTVSPLEMTYIPTGQKILFRGLDDPLSLTSITVEKGFLNWAWFEEFYQINSEDDFNKVDMSIRGELPAGYFKQITGTFNPWNERHWIKPRFFDDPDVNTFVKTTNYLCNEFLGDDDRQIFEVMKVRYPRRYKVEGLGDWGITEGLVYDNWSELNFNWREIVKARPKILSARGLDFGYTADPTAFIVLLIDVNLKEIYIFDEHYEAAMLNNQIAQMIIAKGYGKEEIIADSSEPKSIAEIRLAGVSKIKAARKGQVHPDCVNTILEFSNYAWQPKKDKLTNGKLTNNPIDDFNHLMDALRYAVEKFIIYKTIKAVPRP
jgi:phage terminase large subunit